MRFAGGRKIDCETFQYVKIENCRRTLGWDDMTAGEMVKLNKMRDIMPRVDDE